MKVSRILPGLRIAYLGGLLIKGVRLPKRTIRKRRGYRRDHVLTLDILSNPFMQYRSYCNSLQQASLIALLNLFDPYKVGP